MNERDVIDAFVSHLQETGHPRLTLDGRPDEENRESPDIDAIAGEFAIEHTSIDSIPDQRRDSDWFMHAVGNLEQELEAPLSFRLDITLGYNSVRSGQDWVGIRSALKVWLRKVADSLPEGRSVVEDVPGIPFRLNVIKSAAGRPGVFFARFRPNDDTLPERIQSAFNRKAEKLGKYQARGFTTILLVENEDIALMYNWKMLEAIRAAFPNGNPPGVDQVWYVDTSIENALEFKDFTRETGKCAV